jgi:hypothetical protein
MNKFTIVLFATLFALSTTAYADDSEGGLTACWISAEAAAAGDPSLQVCPEPEPVPVCKPEPKKKKKWKKRKKRKKVTPPPCACEPGPKGDKGDTGIIEIVHTINRPPHKHPHEHHDPSFEISLGWLASSYWPENDYAWAQGPSLRLTSSLKGDRTSNLELGWAPGRDGGIMLRATLTDWDWIDDSDWLGFGGGLYWQAVGTDEDRAQGHYVGFLPEVSIRHDFGPILVSANVGPSLAYAYYDDERSTKGFVLGVVGSAGLTLDF